LVTTSGTWYTHGSGAHSGGSAVLAMDASTKLSLTFQGTGIAWIGTREPTAGMAWVRVDGKNYLVDTYSKEEKNNTPIASFFGLNQGAHTLEIEVSGGRNILAKGTWVWVDAFDIYTSGDSPTPTPTAAPSATPTSTPTPTPGPSPTPGTMRVDDTDARIAYVGSWFANSSPQANHSGGTARLSMDTGDTATFSFQGTGIRWIGVRDAWAGIARVFVDGNLLATVDTYAPMDETHTLLFAADGLGAGTHAIRLEVTGTRNASSGGAWIWLDAFDVVNGSSTPTPSATPTATPPGPTPTPTPTPAPTAPPSRVEDTAASYDGTWFMNGAGLHSGGGAHLAMDAGDRATFTFTGTGVAWIGYSDPWSGIARVLVDGAMRGLVDTYASPEQAQKRLFALTGLTPGSHTITIEATGTHRDTSGGAWVWVDAIDVTP
jgi:hypothetical protein